jgi:hypothetical protein
MSSILQTYKERLPWHGHATDDLQTGVRLYQRQTLLTKAIVQSNPYNSVGWIIVDMDSPTANLDWQDINAPPPNIVSINKSNGHAHLFYGLENPVHKNELSSYKALKYCAFINIALTQYLGGDEGYAMHLSKNPTNGKWLTLYPRQWLYTLDELADWLPNLGKVKRKRLPDISLGRNVNLFENLRMYAYSERRTAIDYQQFYANIYTQAKAHNSSFITPLPNGEIRATAKSIAKWTWVNMSNKGFEEWGEQRRVRSIKKRRQKAEALKEEVLRLREECPEITQKDIALMLGISTRTVIRKLGQGKIEKVASI